MKFCLGFRRRWVRQSELTALLRAKQAGQNESDKPKNDTHAAPLREMARAGI